MLFKKISNKLLIVAFLIVLDNFAFIWKGKENDLSNEKDNWIYVENKLERKIAFLEFENETTSRKEDFNAYRESIPKSIAKQLRGIEHLDLPSKDFIPIIKNREKYKIFNIKSKDYTSLKEEYYDFLQGSRYEAKKILDEITATNVSITNNAASITNEVASIVSTNGVTSTNEIASTNKNVGDLAKQAIKFFAETRIAYAETNQNEYIFYGYQDSPSSYIDAQLISEEDTDKISLPIYTNENGIRFFIYENNQPKKLLLNEKLYSFNTSLEKATQSIEADYIVYGSYKVEGIHFFLDVFVINYEKKTIVNIYSEKIKNSQIREKIRQLSQFIIAYLEEKEIVQNITFTSNPPGTSLYLDNKFQGKMPLVFPSFVKKQYSYRVSLENHVLYDIETNLPGNTEKLSIDRSDGIVSFNMQTTAGEEDFANLNVKINNDVSSDFYFNSDLVAVSETNFNRTLPPGNYYLSVSSENHITRNFKVDLDRGEDLDLSFKMFPDKSNPVRDFFFNHARNVKIFSILGFFLGTSTIAVYLQTLELEDKRNEIDRRLRELSDTTIGYNNLSNYRTHLTRQYNTYALASAGLFAGTLLSFTSALFAHYFDIWEDRIKIESSFEHGRDAKFKVKTSVKF